MLSINNALGILAVCASSIVVIGCGDGEQATSTTASTSGGSKASGGSGGIAGTSTTSVGGGTAGLQIKFCGTTTQLDAINVPTGNPNVNNFCAAVGGNTPATSLLTAAGNPNSNAIADNSATAGWQGTLAACTNIDTTANPGATIQFSANGANIGSPIAIDATSKCATVGNATVPDGAAVLLTATTSPIAGNSGVASITVPVDTTIPGAP